MRCHYIIYSGVNHSYVVCNKPAIGTIKNYPICIDCRSQMSNQNLITVPDNPEEIDEEYNDTEV